MSELIDKYIASIYLSTIGDKIGYNNKAYSTFKNTIKTNRPFHDYVNGITVHYIYRFMYDGGYNGFDIESYAYTHISHMHIDVMHGFINNYNDYKYNYHCYKCPII